MPYLDGVRVSQDEYIARTSNGPQLLHTGPNGENPAQADEAADETAAPKKAKKAGSKRTTTKAKAAVADALGVSTDSPDLPDLTTLDVGASETEAPSADAE